MYFYPVILRHKTYIWYLKSELWWGFLCCPRSNGDVASRNLEVAILSCTQFPVEFLLYGKKTLLERGKESNCFDFGSPVFFLFWLKRENTFFYAARSVRVRSFLCNVCTERRGTTAAELTKREVGPDGSEEACFPRGPEMCIYKAGPVAANGASKRTRRYRGNVCVCGVLYLCSVRLGENCANRYSQRERRQEIYTDAPHTWARSNFEGGGSRFLLQGGG